MKIGFTTNLKERLRSLDKTGVPAPFEPYMTVETVKYRALEKVMHHELDKLTDFRLRHNREFFQIDPVDAADLLKNLATLIDDAIIEDYSNESSVEEKLTTGRESGFRTTFQLLGIPVGSKLVPRSLNIPAATVADETNQVMLEDGTVKSISRAVVDAVGGSRNGFQCYKYQGKVLYDMRKELTIE